MTDFTSEPWQVFRLSPDSDEHERLIVTANNNEDEVCGIVYDDGDARLIAAAPDLYEACKEALRFLDVDAKEVPMAVEAWGSGFPTAERAEWQDRARDGLRDALKRAEGDDD